jgi:hypothetical protein
MTAQLTDVKHRWLCYATLCVGMYMQVSLRFLSFYLLKERIQEQTHDSIIDSNATLGLYNKYKVSTIITCLCSAVFTCL